MTDRSRMRRPGPAVVVRRLAGAVLLGALAGCSSLPMPSSRPTASVDVDRSAAQAMISDYRRSRGLAPVALDSALVEVAQRQADAMASANELSHEVAGPLPRRLARNGVDRAAAIENVSAGYSSFTSALDGWKRSPHHNDNLLFGPMRRMGIAATAAPGTRYKTFWSLVMTN